MARMAKQPIKKTFNCSVALNKRLEEEARWRGMTQNEVILRALNSWLPKLKEDEV